MKRHGILHPELASVLAALGHTDTLVIADAGLPIPPAVPRIDLAFSPGKPGFLEVLEAVLQEIEIERAVLAEEIRDYSPDGFYRSVLGRLHDQAGLETAAVEYVPHDAFKGQLANARAVVRTGEQTPYANVILHSGVTF
ncbi:MAG TPA: D-ribose pyranase [Trueperaceae bacterium]